MESAGGTGTERWGAYCYERLSLWIWVGRDDELADVDAGLVPRRAAGLFERGRTYLGDPGLGKSVLVNRIADDRRRSGDLVTLPLRFARGRDPLAAVAAALEPLVPTGDRVVSRPLARHLAGSPTM